MRPRLSGRSWHTESVKPEKSFDVITADHTGITVSNLERSLAFWRDVLGFEYSHSAHQTGEMAEQITGVKQAELKLAVVKAPGGHKVELLDGEAKHHTVLRDDIETISSSKQSLMPEGFEKLPQEELTSLLEFLENL